MHVGQYVCKLKINFFGEDPRGAINMKRILFRPGNSFTEDPKYLEYSLPVLRKTHNVLTKADIPNGS